MVMKRKVIIIGGVGSGVIVAEAIEAIAASRGSIELLGFLNDREPAGSKIGNALVLGRLEDWSACPSDAQFISAIPAVKDAWGRYRRVACLGIPQERWATIVHPAAQVAKTALIGAGSYIGPCAIVHSGATAGAHVTLRGGCHVSHDVQLGSYVFVGPNASILGRAKLADGAHLGANAVCREGTTVGRYAVVGVGSAVVKNVPEFAVVAGCPARIIGHVRPPEASQLPPNV